MSPSKYVCGKCGRGTSAKQASIIGMCATCTKMWQRLNFQETLAAVPEEAEAYCRDQILDRPTLQLAAAAMNKEYPMPHPYRQWDAALVVLVDERRRSRELRRRSDRDGSSASSAANA